MSKILAAALPFLFPPGFSHCQRVYLGILSTTDERDASLMEDIDKGILEINKAMIVTANSENAKRVDQEPRELT